MKPSGETRKIIHVDMDAFFASVEQRDHPEWRNKPVIVGGSPESRGVVCSASYDARTYGVRSAMSSAQAKRLCPQAIFIHPRFEAYHEASTKIREIFHEVTDLVEPLSLDEAYLDVTENKLGEPLAGKVAIWIKKEIQTRLGLTASAGVASTLFLAKIASDLDKPNGLTIIPPDQALDFIATLPVSKLWGVGPATEARLHALGIKHTLDLRTVTDDQIFRELGKHGLFLKKLSFGIDDRRVDPDWERKSFGNERTFSKDCLSLIELESTLRDQSVDIAESLRSEECRARTLTLKIRYPDFTTVTRSITLKRYTDEPERIFQELQTLLLEKTEAGLKPIRLIGVSASGLIREGDAEQLWFDLPEFL
jgi:DNA polymerase-4